jgi:hypothetical protein
MQLARLLRAGELTEVWVPDEAHEAIRGSRAREAAVDDLRRKRQVKLPSRQAICRPWREPRDEHPGSGNSPGGSLAKNRDKYATYWGIFRRKSLRD